MAMGEGEGAYKVVCGFIVDNIQGGEGMGEKVMREKCCISFGGVDVCGVITMSCGEMTGPRTEGENIRLEKRADGGEWVGEGFRKGAKGGGGARKLCSSTVASITGNNGRG